MKLLPTSIVASRLGVSQSTVRRLINARKIVAVRTSDGGHFRIPDSAAVPASYKSSGTPCKGSVNSQDEKPDAET